MSITLSLFGFGFFAINTNLSEALVDSGDLSITAHVSGCGDNRIDISLSEQCEGPNAPSEDLNGQTCQSLGYSSGNLSCGGTCVFDVSDCSGTASSGQGSGSSSGSRRIVSEGGVRESNLIFSGTAGSKDVIVVLNKGLFFASGVADANGLFSISLNSFNSGDYDFTFYSSSENLGKSFEQEFQIDIRNEATTRIDNIHLIYPELEKEIIISLTDDGEEGSTEKIQLIKELRKPLYDVLVVEIIPEKESGVPYAINLGAGVVYIFIARMLIFFIRPKI